MKIGYQQGYLSTAGDKNLPMKNTILQTHCIKMKHLLPLFCCLLILSCSSQSQQTDKIEAIEFSKAINKPGIQILDVRTSQEFNSGHIENSLWADWLNKSQFLERVQHIDREKPVYIYCLSGGRSHAAASWMRTNGFKNVIELVGGINAWKYNNLPLAGMSNEPQLTLEQYQKSIPPKGTVLVDFGATWCPPCVKMEPVLKSLLADKSLHFTLSKIDAGIHTNLLKSMSIESIPVFIVYKDGKEIWRKQGIFKKEELSAQLK